MSRVREWIRERLDGRADSEEGPEREATWLVLGGGGLKGLAHVGAWKALREAGVEVQGILGTSIGALVGAAIAGGMEVGELEERARRIRSRDIARINGRALWLNGIRTTSVFQAGPLREYIGSSLPEKDWEELQLPLQVNAMDLGLGETAWFGTGARRDVSIPDAVYASAAVPVFYPPADLGGRHYVDGGVGEALALTRARQLGATRIIGVDVGSGGARDSSAIVQGGLVAIHQRVFSIQSGAARRALVEGWSAPPLVFVRPDLDGYGTFDFDHRDYFVDEGYRAAKEAFTILDAERSRGASAEPPPQEGQSRS